MVCQVSGNPVILEDQSGL